MSLTYIILISVGSVLCWIWYFLKTDRPRNFPPGPRGIPIFGNAFQLGRYSFKKALEMGKTYGDIVGLRVGYHRLVFLNNPDDVRDAFSRPEFTGRTGFNSFLDQDCVDVNYGLIFAYGQPWMNRRRFSLRTLRDFGFGKRSIETIIMEDVHELTGRLEKLEGEPICTKDIFNAAIFNVIWSIVAGERYPHDDPRLTELIHLLLSYFNYVLSPSRALLILFPVAVRIKNMFPGLLLSLSSTALMREKMFIFFRKTIEDHRRNFQEGEPRDFIDAYLEEQKTCSGHEADDDMDLIVTLMDFFIAGSETTSTTLIWTFYLLALYPDVQEKLFQEINGVAGDREVSLSDRPTLTYVEATTMEIMRISTLAPLGTLHATTEDVRFKGFVIPKDTIVIGNIYAAHFRPDRWDEPEKFHPDRFISKGRIIRHKSWMPFGVGKRSCMGESLARDEFFLFFTNLVHKIHVSMPEDEPPHGLEASFKGILIPEPHNVLLRARST